MSFEIVLADLKRIYEVNADLRNPRATRLTGTDVQRWSTCMSVPRRALYDQIAMFLALGFHKSELTFNFCDSILIDIHTVIINKNERRPALFWQVFLAFDAGEFYRDNKRDKDPSEEYTRPLIAQIIKSH